MNWSRSRRQFLAALGSLGLAGCSGQRPEEGQRDRTSTSTNSPIGTPTATPTDTTTETVEETETSEQWEVDPLEQDKLVGAHYYPWYWGQEGYGNYTERPWIEHSPYTPELGTYDSRDSEVINQHIKWAVENGVNWFLINTGHPNTDKGQVIEDYYLEAELSDQIQWSVGTGFNHLPVTDDQGRWIIDHPTNIEALKGFMESFEEAGWFDHPNYVHIDGRPVVFDFPVAQYTGDIETAFDEAMEDMEPRPYMIGNPPVIWFPEYQTPENVFAAYDAVKNYVDLPWRDSVDEEEYVTNWNTMAEKWRLISDHYDLDYIPGVTPGVNDTEIDWEGREHHDILDLSPDEFGRLCGESLDYVEESGPNAVIVTSWNEFPEGTAIEPAEEYGHTRLETVKENVGQSETSPIETDSYPFVELEFDRTFTPPDTDRSLAVFLTGIDTTDGSETVRSYDIGNYSEEPVFVDGTFLPSRIQGTSGRWLGGESERASLYVHPETVDASMAVLHGKRAGNQDITADVYVDGGRTGQVTFDSNEISEHRVGLT